MNTTSLYGRLINFNKQLPLFPGATKYLKLKDDELLGILEFTLPYLWRMHMTLAHFDPHKKTAKETLNHYKGIKGIEI